MPYPYRYPITYGELKGVAVRIGGDYDTSIVVLRGSIRIEKRIEERSTASFTVVDETGTAVYYRGQTVTIYDLTDTLIFAGFIDTPGRARIAPNYGLLHDITCMDNHYLADKKLVVKSYATPGQTLGDIVNDIYTDYLVSEGVLIGEIQAGPVVEKAVFNYVDVAECFDALKELSGFTWFINELKKLYFVDRATYLSPWNLDSIVHRAIQGSIHLQTGNPLYRNRQYVRGGTGVTTSSQTANFTGDGVTKSFTVGYPIASEPDVRVNAVLQSIGIKGIDTGKACYWSKGDATVTFTAAPGTLPIVIAYYGQYPLIALAADYGAQIARQAIEGGTGMVESIVTEAQHDTREGITASAKGKLSFYCQDAERFVYQTYESGLLPGQLQAITFAPLGFTAHDMLIESVSISAEGEVVLYDVVAITGPTMGSWSKFFSSILRRQDKSISIGDALLSVLLQQVEALSLVETTDFHSDAFPPDVSRWIALPPAQGAGHHVRHEAMALAEEQIMDMQDFAYWGDLSDEAIKSCKVSEFSNLRDIPFFEEPSWFRASRPAKWDFFSWA